MNYVIIRDRDEGIFEDKVTHAMEKGWVLAGGVCLKPGTAFGSQEYVQALYKND